MKKLKFLNVQFNAELHPSKIAAFRGAIIQKVGQKDTLLFHNHLDDEKFNYQYALVQYKTIAKRPTIICMGEGVEVIHKFFEKSDWTLNIAGEEYQMSIHKLNMQEFTMQTWDKMMHYTLLNWLPLNQQSYEEYQKMTGLVEKTQFLEKKIIGHILAFAKGIAWQVENEIKVNITEMQEPRLMYYKNIKMMAFSLTFKTNVFLPNYMGLGKGVSLGFGIVKKIDF
ncbi:MAG: hypothetical protein EAZ55_10660 [Cytophagales bacterium]|nr:MAG: hypothetical protein EAZ55_10660 [Cytophagales bacterium]